ncbi:prtgb [Acrasis kona]|uniref:Prtgb n=1 Tax=Acrasis kona TaxID=1008807 RepID=A0AAW2YRX4_9EUKA
MKAVTNDLKSTVDTSFTGTSYVEALVEDVKFKFEWPDVIPLILGVVVVILCIAASVTSFILVRQESSRELDLNFDGFCQDTRKAIQITLDAAKDAMIRTMFMLNLKNGEIGYDEFVQFAIVDGELNGYMVTLDLIKSCTHDQIKQVEYDTRQKGREYSNFSIKEINKEDTGYVPVGNRSVHYYNYISVPNTDNATMQSLGYDHSSVDIKLKALNEAIKNPGLLAVTTFTTLAMPGAGGTQLYLVGGPNNSMILSGTMTVLNIMPSSMDKTKEVNVVIKDVLMPQNVSVYVSSTQNEITLQESGVELISYNKKISIFMGLRRYELSIYPQPSFVKTLFIDVNKYYGVIISVCIALLLIPLCVFAFFLRRLYNSHQIRQSSKLKIMTMNAAQHKLASIFKRIVVQEERTNSILDSLNSIIIVLDGNGKVIRTNNSFENILMYPQIEVEAGLNVVTFVPNLRVNIMNGETPWPIELHNVNVIACGGKEHFCKIFINTLKCADPFPNHFGDVLAEELQEDTYLMVISCVDWREPIAEETKQL